jgi:hypothetical protein
MNRTHGVTHFNPESCFGCHAMTVQMAPANFQPHFNYTVGKFVRNEQEFRDALKRAGDKNSEKTGISHNYEYLHPADIRSAPPPEEAPSHVPDLPSTVREKAGIKTAHHRPTGKYERSRRRERAKASSSATEEAQTRDIIHDTTRDKYKDINASG